MNIFYLSHDVDQCSTYHADKHVVKMVLEYAQLLSTAHRILDGKEVLGKSKTGRNVKRWVLDDHRESVLYSATHINHPSAVWVRQSFENYVWLSDMLFALLKEYTYRYGKHHKCEQIARYLGYPPTNISMSAFTEPTPAMPDEVKISHSSIASYRNYYNRNKQHLASWKGKVNSRSVPEWFTYSSDKNNPMELV
jgi:predicted NodU family carbamoyl transferase